MITGFIQCLLWISGLVDRALDTQTLWVLLQVVQILKSGLTLVLDYTWTKSGFHILIYVQIKVSPGLVQDMKLVRLREYVTIMQCPIVLE